MEIQDLKKVGLKATLPRIRILEILEHASQHHVSAEDVYKALLEAGEDVGLATIYRVLTQFEAAGLVTRHNFEGGHSIFELSQGTHHDHIVCIKCGRIEEFCDATIEKQQKKIAKRAGYELTEHSLILYGTCSNCRG